jgi:hypothetical protein
LRENLRWTGAFENQRRVGLRNFGVAKHFENEWRMAPKNFGKDIHFIKSIES